MVTSASTRSADCMQIGQHPLKGRPRHLAAGRGQLIRCGAEGLEKLDNG